MAVFRHGRLRLYLLRLLDDGPKHGYELIRLLESRFHGRYAPSAGTVYPRLARLATEGRVTQAVDGGRKVYALTEAGRAELRDRRRELAALESDIVAYVREQAGRQPADPPAEPRTRLGHLDAAGALEGCLADFTTAVRGVLRDARRGGAEPGTVVKALETSLDGAVHTLRRLLS